MADAEQPVTAKPKKIKMNSRWRKGAQRYDTKRTVEDVRFIRRPDGSSRKEADSPTEVKYNERRHETAGWRRGARVRKVGN